MKKILVSCAAGVASSQAVASKLRNLCEGEELDVSIKAVDLKSLENSIGECDVHVSLVPAGAQKWGKPVINGIPFLTGYKMDEEFNRLKKVLTK